MENFPPDKIFVLPHYKCNEHLQGPNVYRIKTSISDVDDEDFAKAAREYKAKQTIKLERESRET